MCPAVSIACRADWTEVLMSDGIEPITGYPAAAFFEDRQVSLSNLMHRGSRGHPRQDARCIESHSPYASSIGWSIATAISTGARSGPSVYDNDGTLL